MTTLLELRTRARQRADQVGSTFCTDSELNTWANLGLAELYDQVVGAFEDYFITTTTLTVSSGNTVALPSDFYKLRGLDFSNGNGSYQTLREFGFTERNSTQAGSSFLYNFTRDRKYRILGDNLMLLPETFAIGSYRLFYVPAVTVLTLDASEVPASLSKFGWDEYIVLYMAERMLSKEESPITDVSRERGEIAGRILQMAANRQVDQAETVQDVRRASDDWWWV
jgi:hypothetical protein